MVFPADYEERVYAGVLGKIIGVYLGRPFEGWSYERLRDRFGEVVYYVHEQLGQPLVVTDDDISGTFTFLRALEDYTCSKDLTAAQVGQTWLNYLIQNRTVLWWGGMGMSTENTAYLRLKAGIPAPQSGSIAMNGRTVAEQIGAQIFIDGWGMVAPGDPALAAALARKAASVSHDGEAIYAAQVIAAMEAAAFIEPDIQKLLDIGLSVIPGESAVARLIGDLRAWREQTDDWHEARRRLAEKYGYQHYGGVCHVIPNHGVIILGLLYGDDDFQKSLTVTNTAGWDTDCNSGNVGCLMGIKNGLEAFEGGPDWRGPVADRMYLPTADGARCVTDAVTEACRVAALGRCLNGQPGSLTSRGTARFHFSFPGSVQGFAVQDNEGQEGAEKPESSRENVILSNDMISDPPGSDAGEDRALKVTCSHLEQGERRRIGTATFIPPDARSMGGYSLVASPSLYPGQTVHARVVADQGNGAGVGVGLYVRAYGANDEPFTLDAPETVIAPDHAEELQWRVPETGGSPIFEVGIAISGQHAGCAIVYLECLGWRGVPTATFGCPEHQAQFWIRSWIPGTTRLEAGDTRLPLRVIQDEGCGLVSQGAREWTDYTVRADLTPRIGGRVGLAARVQGQRRFVALLLGQGHRAQLVQHLDGERVLDEVCLAWSLDEPCPFSLTVRGLEVTAVLPGGAQLRGQCNPALRSGAIGIFCEAGRVDAGPVSVRPVA